MRALLILLALSLFGAENPWAELREKNPPEMKFSLRLVEPRAYRQGELIEVEVALPGRQFTPGRGSGESWQFAGVLLDPADECGSIEQPCTLYPARFKNFDPMLSMGSRAEPAAAALNTYVPALAPGRYRAAVLVRKLVNFDYADPPVLAVSNAVEFEILPASEEWIVQTVEQCVKTLEGSRQHTREGSEMRRAAAQQLSFLDHPPAWRASLDLLPTDETMLLSGLSASEAPAEVCGLMRERLAAPQQVVSRYYMSRMVEICRRADLPVPPETDAPEQERAEYFRTSRLYDAALNREAHTELAASLGRKQPEAKASAIETLMRRIQHLRLNEPEEPTSAWIPTLRRELAGSLPSFDALWQRRLFGTIGAGFAWPELAPALEAVLDGWKPGDYYETAHTALRALHAVDARCAHAKILAELRKPKTWMNAGLLELLPASAVPPIDDALIEALAEAQRPGGWNPRLRMAALAKYATAEALPRMRAIYESQQDPCQPELMAYLVRVDPEYAEQVFHREEWDMQADPPSCAVQYFVRTAALAMHPVLEEYMAAFLMHHVVPVKQAAARSLGRYGSPAALGPLWDAFRYFHDYWEGKGEPNLDGVELEVELRNAIARGRNWLADEADLRLMQSLCVTRRCLNETWRDLGAWQGAPRIEIYEQPPGIRGAVAQYWGIETVAELKAKLSQFPRGTQFVLRASGPEAREAAAEIRSFAGERGLVITDAAPARGQRGQPR